MFDSIPDISWFCYQALLSRSPRKCSWGLRMVVNALPSGRIELPTFGLGNRCSIQLSYEDMVGSRPLL